MNCPHCNKVIYGMTGLQELNKFRAHLRRCKKYQTGDLYERDGRIRADAGDRPSDLMTALEQRAESGQ